MAYKPKTWHKNWLLAAACVAAWSSAGTASAQTSPYYIGGGLNFNHVSNIYRQNDNANSDNVTSASLLAGIDQSFGRQRLFGDATLQTNRYSRNTDLNNNSYSLKAGVDWATLERLSGTLSGTKTRALAAYDAGGVAQIFKKNVEDNSSIDAVARLGLVTRYSLEAGASYRSRDFSAVEYASQVVNQNRYSLGLMYRPSSDLRLGVSGRRTNGEYPRYRLTSPGVYTASEFRRNDIDLTARWVVSGASTLDGRVSYGKSTSVNGVGRDFSGGTGQVTWSWQPTGKLSLTTILSRDTGLETSFINASSGSLSSDLNQLTTALQVYANYELTGKVALNAGANISRNNRNSVFLAQTAEDSDRFVGASLGARWQYSRSILLGCQVTYQSRDSTASLNNYTANSYGCSGQITLR